MDDETTSNDTPDDAPGDAPHLTVIDGGAGTADTDQAKPKGTGNAKRRKMTAKQERFLAEMIRGATQADAYRTAYSAGGMKPSAIYTEAGRIMAHPEVTRRLHAHQDSIERSAASSALSRRTFVLEGLEREATGADSDSARVAALIALGKTQGVDLFTDRVEQVADRSPDEVRAALETKLADLLGRTG
jgi:hypothetical protein